MIEELVDCLIILEELGLRVLASLFLTRFTARGSRNSLSAFFKYLDLDSRRLCLMTLSS